MALPTPTMGILLLGAVIGSGCFGKRDFSTDGDALREQVLTLEQENAALVGQVAELEAELNAAAAAPDSLPAEARAAVPHPVAIRLRRTTHLRDTDDDGRFDLLIAYVVPEDGRGRFVPLVGDLTVIGALVPVAGEPITVARATLGPLEVRDAYRSGFTGTHYTIECPLLATDFGQEPELIVRAVFDDAATGRALTTHRAIPVVR